MHIIGKFIASASVVALLSGAAFAQTGTETTTEADITGTVETSEPTAAAQPIDTTPAQAMLAEVPAREAICELHVWPTENYLGIQMGLLSGFGALGALADMAAHDGKVKTVKNLMREYLGPEVQMEELNRIGINKTLKLNDYAIIVHEPTPFNEELKDNPELKAKTDAINAKLKSGERQTDVTKPCYAELYITHIFYHKAMMYGSNLFTGFLLRDYTGGQAEPKLSKGQVKNPLEEFPPKSADMIPVAQVELRDAFSKDFVEWSEKKLKK